MNDYKILKDPIYGYIRVPTDLMSGVIDTAGFQRLRRIIQTSYSPLFSSAVHNRFVHSIGVYHLGKIAFSQLENEIKIKFPTETRNVEKIGNVFLLACLLHDVGHAPFSHTGEKFFLDENEGYSHLHELLTKKVDTAQFTRDIPTEKSKAAAPHEIMSAIVGLAQFGKLLRRKEAKEFFARCITGYRYSEKTQGNRLKNCFISLLNSKVIDVDKLDYLIRDAYITGYDTISIDYERLLSSLTVISTKEGYQLAYYKSAISVIENVVYAHDSERKWIQNHPVVLYESYILQHIISRLNTHFKDTGKQLFSFKSLCDTGQNLGKNFYIRLMSDDDIVYLMKNLHYDALTKEFFERNSRCHPVWKSEAEYKAFFFSVMGKGDILYHFEKAMEATAKYLAQTTDSWMIDHPLIEKLEAELTALEQANLDDASKSEQRETKRAILKIAHCLSDCASEMNIDCNFVILKASQFSSGFGKPDFSQTKIVFKMPQNREKVTDVEKIVSSLKAKEQERDNFFYLFYKRKTDDNAEFDSERICNMLICQFFPQSAGTT